MTKPTMVSKAIGEVVLAAHATPAPTEQEWTAYLELFRPFKDAGKLESVKALVWSHGGSPDAKQRRAMLEFLGRAAPPTAIVTPVSFVRGVVTVLSWFRKAIRAFGPTQVDEAFAWVGIPQSSWAGLRHELTLLKRQVALPETVARPPSGGVAPASGSAKDDGAGQ